MFSPFHIFLPIVDFYFHTLWLEKMLAIISILLNLLRLLIDRLFIINVLNYLLINCSVLFIIFLQGFSLALSVRVVPLLFHLA